MTWDEIIEQYPESWVAIRDAEKERGLKAMIENKIGKESKLLRKVCSLLISVALLSGLLSGIGSQDVYAEEAESPSIVLGGGEGILMTSAPGGKPEAALGTMGFVETTVSGNDWKQTTLDGSRSFTASVTEEFALMSAERYGEWTVPFSYSGAGTGENEYVSVLLADSGNTVLYYGNIAKNSGSGTAELSMPLGLSQGNYILKVYSEQKNGNDTSDKGSSFVDIPVWVTGNEVEPAIKLGTGSITNGDTVSFGIDNRTWVRIGDANDGTDNAALMIMEYVFEDNQYCRAVDIDYEDNRWKNSHARTCCQTYYNGGFTDQEKATILTVNKTDDEYTITDVVNNPCVFGASVLVNDKLFFLSAEELHQCFPDVKKRIASDGNGNAKHWWLRSPQINSYEGVGLVFPSGGVGHDDVTKEYGYRPAFNLNLESVLFTSAAVGGKSSGTGGVDALKKINNVPVGARKLTLKDSSRTGFEASINTNSVNTGSDVLITWSGAKTGEKEYISALLCDDSDKPLYYGSIAHNRESGSEYLTIPNGLTTGYCNLYVFNEEKNGDGLTDYAGELDQRFYLTVNYGPHRITFDAQGGAIESSWMMTNADKKLPYLPTASRAGKRLLGWFTEAEGGTQVTTETVFESSTTVYAHWEDLPVHSVTVTVTPAGSGTASSDLNSGTRGTGARLSKNASDGWIFKEWQVSSGDVVIRNDRFVIRDSDVEIKAIFEPLYTVNVISNINLYGTASASISKGVSGKTVTLTAVPNKAPNNAYTFVRWEVVSGGVTIDNPESTSASFEIGSANVEIRAVFEQKYIGGLPAGGVIYLGSDRGAPIPWRIINGGETSTLMISGYILGSSRFRLSGEGWNGSTIRNWCVDYYNNNFYSGEKSAIKDTEIDGQSNKLYVLDRPESYLKSEDERIATLTDGTTSKWWTRYKDGGYANNAYYQVISTDGSIGRELCNNTCGVRPAFDLDFRKVLFVTGAMNSTGKPSGNVGGGALTTVPANDFSEYKLTLLATGRDTFDASISGTGQVEAGGSVNITWSNARTGDNEYVSVRLLDSDGKALYYGRIAKNTAAGSVDLSIPAGLPDGYYKLLVFNEQYNKDKFTDYASPLREFSLSLGNGSPTKEVRPDANFTATGADCGTLTDVEGGMRYSTDGGTNWTDITGASVTISSGVSADNGIKVYKPGNGTTTSDSNVQTISVTKASKPSGLSKTDCTTASNNDGTISGVTVSMEYKKSGDSEWTEVTGNVISALSNGTYYIRTKASGTTLASDNLKLTIATYVAPGQVATPTFNLAGGTYASTQSIDISCPTKGAEIYYTTNGDIPSSSTDTKYTSAISVLETTTIKAIAVKKGMKDSEVASSTYTINIGKTDPMITKAPVAITGLFYNGKAQALITAGEVTGGILYYAVTKTSDPEPVSQLYTTSIPTAIDAGIYMVYYKVIQDKDHKDKKAQSISVTINKAENRALSNITQNRNKGITGIEIPIDAVIPKDAGAVSGYTLDSEVSATGSVKINNAKVSPEGVVTADLSDGADGDTITIPIKVTANNYDCTLSIIIALNNKKDPEFTAPKAKAGLVYDGTEQELVTKGSVTGEGEMQYVLDDEEGVYSTDLPTGKDALNYTVYYRIPESGTVNGVDPTPVNVAIARKAVKVKAEDKTKEKGSADPSFTAVIDGLVDGEKESLISFTLSREDGEEPGTYVITPSGDKEQGNYTVTYETGILTIEEKETPKPVKQSQELKFTESRVTLKIGDEFTNTLSGAKTAVSFKSSDEAVASVGDDGKVTAIAEGTTTIMAEACETDEYYAGSAEFTITVEEKKEEEKDEPEKKPDKVPFTTEGEFYASTEDNFAAESGSGKITGLVLDFSRISESSVAPSDLKMTAISGSRFTTKAALKDKKSFKADKGIKVKVNKSTLIPAITVKKSGSVTLEMSDGNSFTIAFRVEKPKAVKKEKQQRQGSGKITKTISDLFGTSIDSGELTATGNAEVYGNSAIIDTAEKGSIKIQYKYLNKKYKMTVKVK